MNEWSIFQKHVMNQSVHIEAKTRPETRLLKLCAGGQGPYLRSVEHFGRSGIAKNPMNTKKVKCEDGQTDGRTDRPTDGQSGM